MGGRESYGRRLLIYHRLKTPPLSSPGNNENKREEKMSRGVRKQKAAKEKRGSRREQGLAAQPPQATSPNSPYASTGCRLA